MEKHVAEYAEHYPLKQFETKTAAWNRAKVSQRSHSRQHNCEPFQIWMWTVFSSNLFELFGEEGLMCHFCTFFWKNKKNKNRKKMELHQSHSTQFCYWSITNHVNAAWFSVSLELHERSDQKDIIFDGVLNDYTSNPSSSHLMFVINPLSRIQNAKLISTVEKRIVTCIVSARWTTDTTILFVLKVEMKTRFFEVSHPINQR